MKRRCVRQIVVAFLALAASFETAGAAPWPPDSETRAVAASPKNKQARVRASRVLTEGRIPLGLYSQVSLREGQSSNDEVLQALEGDEPLLKNVGARVVCIQPHPADGVVKLQSDTANLEFEQSFDHRPVSRRSDCATGQFMVGPFSSLKSLQDWELDASIPLSAFRLPRAYLTRVVVAPVDHAASFQLEPYVMASQSMPPPSRDEMENAGLPGLLQYERPSIQAIRPMTRHDALERREWFPGRSLDLLGATIPGVFRVDVKLVVPAPEGLDRSKTTELVSAIYVVRFGDTWRQVTSSGIASTQAEGRTTGDSRCSTPCRFLATVALEKAGDAYQQACGKPWSPPGPADCQQLDYFRNCVFAAAGFSFQRQEWRAAFASQPWYAMRSDFKPTDLSQAASRNIEKLKAWAANCGTTGAASSRGLDIFTASRVSRTDQAAIVEWFRGRAKHDVWLPGSLRVDGAPVTPSEFRKRLAQPNLFQLKPWTPFDYTAGREGEPREIVVSTGAPPPDCVPDPDSEDCEGFEWISFQLDGGGTIRGISIGAAACPLVYVEVAGGGLSYQGEILRHVARESVERTQRLRLDPGVRFAGPVRVWIVEAKEEITYLDDVALIVDGRAVTPRACVDATPPAYCVEDEKYFALRRGEHVVFTFDIPDATPAREVSLQANGFYEEIDVQSSHDSDARGRGVGDVDAVAAPADGRAFGDKGAAGGATASGDADAERRE